MLNLWQQKVAETYGGGDYAHITELDEARDVGDTLFTFLMIELDEGEGCDSAGEALRRVQTAIEQLEEIERELTTLSQETP